MSSNTGSNIERCYPLLLLHRKEKYQFINAEEEIDAALNARC